jgi:hypothetical protein
MDDFYVEQTDDFQYYIEKSGTANVSSRRRRDLGLNARPFAEIRDSSQARNDTLQPNLCIEECDATLDEGNPWTWLAMT